MDSMSDELMLRILGHLDCGYTLLDVVPLVCKRWRRLSKDREAWAGVVVELGRCEQNDKCDYDEDKDEDYDEADDRMWWMAEDHREMKGAARILLHAPALRRLEIDWSGSRNSPHWVPLCCDLWRRVSLSALRRCRAEIRELVMPQMYEAWDDNVYWMENPLAVLGPEEVGALASLLVVSRRSLRVLKLGMLLAHQNVELAVSELKHLRSLDLALDDDYSAHGHLGCPAALPALEHLKVYWDGPIGEHEFADKLLADLLHGVAGRLRRLHIDSCIPMPARVVTELRRCVELRELACYAGDLTVLPALPALSRLRTLDVHTSDSDESGCTKTAATLAAATAALRALDGPLTELVSLRVDLRPIGLTLWPAVQSLLEALASAASAATTLDLVSQDIPGIGELFLSRMRALRCVSTYHCTPAVLAALAELDGLERLTSWYSCTVGWMSPLPDLDEALETVGGDRVTVRDVVGRLRRLRTLKLRDCPPSYLPLLATLPELRELHLARVSCKAKKEADCICKTAIADFVRLRPDVKAKLPQKHWIHEAPGSG